MALGLIRSIYDSWKKNELGVHASALSFYILLTIGPLMLLLFSLASYFLDPSYLNRVISDYLQVVVGEGGRELVFELIERAHVTGENILRLFIAILILLISVTRSFGIIQKSLNKIWHIESKSSLKKTVRKRIKSIFLLLFLAFAILFSFILNIVISSFVEFLGLGTFIFQAALGLLSFAIVWLMFASIYKVLPDERLKWRTVLKGSAVTALLFVLGQFLFIIYIQNIAATSGNTIVESILVIMLWIYYSSLCFMLGAQASRELSSGPIIK